MDTLISILAAVIFCLAGIALTIAICLMAKQIEPSYELQELTKKWLGLDTEDSSKKEDTPKKEPRRFYLDSEHYIDV